MCPYKNIEKSVLHDKAAKSSVKTDDKVATFQRKQPRFVPEDSNQGHKTKAKSYSPPNKIHSKSPNSKGAQGGMESSGFQNKNLRNQPRNIPNHRFENKNQNNSNFQNQKRGSGGNGPQDVQGNNNRRSVSPRFNRNTQGPRPRVSNYNNKSTSGNGSSSTKVEGGYLKEFTFVDESGRPKTVTAWVPYSN